MPEVSRFYGIRIFVCFEDHPPPHFHAEYAEHEAQFDIRTLALLQGSLPSRARAMVLDWASQHRDELMTAWQAASAGRTPDKIAPLD
jgi:hypothetical protein